MRLQWLIVSLLCSGCAALDADPWGWLNEPLKQSWREIRVLGYERDITFSIPDRSNNGGKTARIWPPLDHEVAIHEVRVSRDSIDEQPRTVAQFIWDQWWGGFYKESGHDFSLNVRIKYRPEAENLLGLRATERVAREIEYRESVYSAEDEEAQRIRDYFFERYWVKSAYTKEAGPWVVHNNPAVTADHIYYTIPITDHHILEFSFFVRDKRYDWKDDPEWNARRWALVEEIMNTVRIDPAPLSPDTGAGDVAPD